MARGEIVLKTKFKTPSGFLPHFSHNSRNKAGLKRKRGGYKTRLGGKKCQVGKAIKDATRNKYFMAQAGTPQAIRTLGVERSLPITWWLPKSGGEDVPRAPLPKAMSKSPQPLRTINLSDIWFKPGCACWEVLLFLLFQPVLVRRGFCPVLLLVRVCHLQGKVGMGIKVAGEALWPPGSGSSPPPSLMARFGPQDLLQTSFPR